MLPSGQIYIPSNTRLLIWERGREKERKKEEEKDIYICIWGKKVMSNPKKNPLTAAATHIRPVPKWAARQIGMSAVKVCYVACKG